MLDAPRQIAKPEVGYWLMRLTKGGPQVAAAIMWLETVEEPGVPENRMVGTRSRHLAAFIAGEPVSVDEVWLRRGVPITRDEYHFRLSDMAWAKQHAPDEPIAKPRERIDLTTAPPVYQRRG